jgi:hypothetical protein
MISLEFGPIRRMWRPRTRPIRRRWASRAQWDAEAELRAALRSARIRILTQFNAIPQGVKFLVDLRADLLRYLDEDPIWRRSTASWNRAWRPGSTSASSNCSASPGTRRRRCWKS